MDKRKKANLTNKSVKKESRHRAAPCKRMNHRASSPTKHTVQTSMVSSGMFGEGAGSINNLKTNTKYDDDIKHSKELHSDKCKEHKRSVYSSYKGRKFVSTDRTDFDALLGKGGLYADHMPASDIPLRKKMGNLLINEMHSLWKLGEEEPEMNFYWVTFVADKYMFNERGGTAEVYKLTQAVQAALRNYTSLNAIGVIENQAIVNYPKDRKGKAFSVHAHVICYGTGNDVANLKRHAKGFKSSITKLPIHSSKVYQTEGSFGRLARYMAKPPCEGKEVNYDKLDAGAACLSSARRVEKYHDLRLFEYNAKLPMENTLFGVRDGVEVRNRIVAGMKDWQKTRKGQMIEMGDRVCALFEDFLRDNKRLKNYSPLQVIFRKDH